MKHDKHNPEATLDQVLKMSGLQKLLTKIHICLDMRRFSGTMVDCRLLSNFVTLCQRQGAVMKTSRPSLKRRLADQNGSALIMSLLVLSVMAIAGFSVAKMSSADTMSSALNLQADKAGYLAQAGLEAAMSNMYNTPPKSPEISTTTLADGTFSVTADPTSRKLVATGNVGDASRTYSITTNFSADCVAVEFGNANYSSTLQGWGHLDNIVVSSTCSEMKQMQIKEVRVMFSNPHPARLVQDITFNDTTSVYHVPAAISGYPSGGPVGTPLGGAQSKEIINSQDYTFSTSSSQKLGIWWNTTFTTSVSFQLQLVFVDGSVYTTRDSMNLPL